MPLTVEVKDIEIQLVSGGPSIGSGKLQGISFDFSSTVEFQMVALQFEHFAMYIPAEVWHNVAAWMMDQHCPEAADVSLDMLKDVIDSMAEHSREEPIEQD